MQLPIKREIRPTQYLLDVVKEAGRTTLVLIHPLDGEAFIYTLDDANREKLKQALTGADIQIANTLPEEKLH